MIDGRTNGWMDKQTNKWTVIDKEMDGWIDGRTDGLMTGWWILKEGR